MDNCIYTAHCTEKFCDKSCPILAEVSYLMERNGITVNNAVVNTTNKDYPEDVVLSTIDKSQGDVKSVITADTVSVANLFTYYAICTNWQGSRLHCNVYNLKYGTYINQLKQSWNTKQESTELEYMRIWAESAKILIISAIDYVTFNDFECQTLLSLIQSRKTESKSTIIISPNPKYLVGKSNFFNRVLDVIQPGKRGGLL